MTRNECMQLFTSLAYSQGSYGRLLTRIQEADEDTQDEFFAQFESCKDSLDIIMQLEG